VALIATDALGPDRVHGVSMPSRYTTDGSRTDAETLAATLGIDFRTVPIEGPHGALLEILAGPFAGRPPGLTEENLQSRIRGVILMALSNKLGWLVLTTGRPKGIVHLQHDMAYSEAAFARNVLKLKGDDICFSVPKIFFAYGFGNSITFPFAAGAAALLLPGQPKPAAIFEAIERFRPSVFFGLPTLYTSLTKADGAAATDFSSLRMALSAAEVLSADVFNGWKTLTGLEIVEGLGSTEVLHIYLSNHPERKKLGAAGLRVPGYEIALRNKDGREVGDNEEGILWVRGDSNTPLYWNRPGKSAETIRDEGWIYTGDRFVRDSDGFHFFRAAADDLIKISGQWVYPLEVELCLAEHPQVRECAVFAAELPDRRMTLKAVVVMNDRAFDASDATRMLQDFVKAKLLPYKYPREVKFIDELPKTGTGKIDRQALLRI